MRITRSLLFFSVVFLAMMPVLKAQSQSEPPLDWGGFNIQGSASMGYRFTDVKGYEPMFQELFDLKNGPRLTDFSLFGHNNNPDAFANDFSLTTSGLGGDPYPGAQFTLSKHNLYDLRVNWRQAYFYWNQNNDVLLPPLVEPGLTNNHGWDTVRKIGSIDFTLHATNNLRFHFQYYRTTFSGATFTTFVPDYFGAPGYVPGQYGAFIGTNPYNLYAPTFNNTNRFSGGMDYTWRNWNFHYDVGYQTFNGSTDFNNITSPEFSFNTTTASTASTPLLNASWTQFEQLTTPISEFSYNGKAESWVDVRGSYTFYRYRGPSTFDQAFNGYWAPGTPYTVSESARATVSEPDNIIHQGATFHVKPWWDIDLDWRYDRFTTDAVGNYKSLFNGTPDSGQTLTQWKDGMNQLDLALEFTPTTNLVVRPGVALLQSNIERLDDHVADPANTLRINTVNPTLGVFYRPTKWFDLRGSLQTFDTGASFFAISPHTDVVGRVVGTVRLNNKLSLSDEMYIDNQQLLATNYHGKVQSNSTMLNYAFNAKYMLFAGFSYDNEFATGDVQYARGGASDLVRDQALNRIWQAGLAVEPIKYFGIRFTGNFDRTTGVGELNGQVPEAPAYGPLTWPLGTGSVYFNIPRAGRLSVDLQRSYYIQQIVTGNNFSANILMVRWTRNF